MWHLYQPPDDILEISFILNWKPTNETDAFGTEGKDPQENV